ncbi:FecR family protein [Catalinimonas niigatensis]|uniref:FecR family protein n=1 Tax=Catalinimonas niigatensis TaxID=1397264 RepID=UPI002665EDAE|nr:FecR family protein [Catalinimonas niigatensis]WPP51987.1 FecR domain-containing protein [Catalinimonas niigatensis]
MMNNTDIYPLIGRVLAGEATQKDHHLLQEWLNASDENQAVYENLRQLWHQTRIRDQFSNADRVYKKMLIKRDQSPVDEDSNSQQHRGNIPWLKAGVAAALLIVGMLSFLFLQRNTPVATVEEKTAWIMKENPAGQKSKILLSDGTIVWLNSESQIRYFFNDTIRNIELEGEAYFEVAKDTVRPFIVTSGYLQTTALGTEFNVKNYAVDSIASIFLAEGRVKVEKIKENGSIEFLEPGWGISTSKDSERLEKFTGLSEQWTGWKDGVLYFDDANLDEVITACERWYSVEMSIEGTPAKDWKFTAKFKNENLENVLESMCYGKDISYLIEDKYVKLKF